MPLEASSSRHLLFQIEGIDLDLVVSDLRIEEGISMPFRIELDLALWNEHGEVTPEEAVEKVAHVGIELSSGDVGTPGEVHWYHGVVSSFRLMGTSAKWLHYQVVVQPEMHFLTLGQRTRTFQELTLDELIKKIVVGEYLQLSLNGDYPTREYTTQYQESDWAFLSRLMEQAGVFYFFTHDEDATKLVVTDHNNAFPGMAPSETLIYKPRNQGLEEARPWETESVVQSFQHSVHMVAGSASIRDYNYEKPNLSLKQEASLQAGTTSVHDEFAPNIAEPSEAKGLAQVRAELLATRQTIFEGESDQKALRSGLLVEMTESYSTSLDGKYVLTRVVHLARQSMEMGTEAGGNIYRNEFTAIKAGMPFRPERKTPWPVIPGVINAKVDSSGTGEYADIDADGRYIVTFPMDLDAKPAGKGSRWVRMAQPYAGENYGIHFPLHRDTEVLISHVNGDPDRPVIAGAVSNPVTPSVVTNANQTQSVIRTAGKNELRFEDQQGSEQIYLKATKDVKAEIANNDDRTVGANQTLTVGNNQTETITGNRTTTIAKDQTDTVGGNVSQTIGAASTETVAAAKSVTIGAAYQVTVGAAMNETVGGAKAEEVGGAKSETVAGGRALSVGGDFTIDVDGGQTSSIKKVLKTDAKEIVFQAQETITIKVGKAKIVMKQNGEITIEGANISVKGDGNLVLKGAKVAAN